MATDTEQKNKTNGTTQAAEESQDLTADERAWLGALLSHAQVCSLFVTVQDKAMAHNIQAKLSE